MWYSILSADPIPHLLTFVMLAYAAAEDARCLHIPGVCSTVIMLSAAKIHLKAFFLIAALWLLMILFVSIFALPLPMGTGDAKLLAALAFSYGINICTAFFAIASVLSGAFALFLVIRTRINNKALPKALPFAPFIAAAFSLLLPCLISVI